jgi:hypothetical protein
MAVAQTSVTAEDVLRANERNIRHTQQCKVLEADVFLQVLEILILKIFFAV